MSKLSTNPLSRRLLITGAQVINTMNPKFNYSQSDSPYFIKRSDATNLGLRLLHPTPQGAYDDALVNVMATDNPLMFHEDFCAEYQVPIVVGRGAITLPQDREASHRLCMTHGWNTKPARWINVEDVLSAGLEHHLQPPNSLYMTDTEGRTHPRMLPVYEWLADRLPLLTTSHHGKKTSVFRRHIHVDVLGLPPEHFMERNWPYYVTRLLLNPQHYHTLQPACGNAAVTRNLNHPSMWMSRSAAQLLGADCSSHMGRVIALDELTHLDDASRKFLASYVAQDVRSGDRIFKQPHQYLVRHALQHRNVVTPYWLIGAREVPTQWEVNPLVPELAIQLRKDNNLQCKNLKRRSS